MAGLTILCLAAAISLAAGIKKELQFSMDFQWSGAHLLYEGIDPWQVYLAGNPDHSIIMTQDPNYLHELYVIMLPLGRLSFHTARVWWSVANVLFLATSIALVGRLYALSTQHLLLLGCLMLMSGPVRVALGNGQQSLFVLTCFVVAFSVPKAMPRGCALGLGFVKYSFAPVVLLLSLLRLRWTLVVSMALPILAGLLIVWRITGTELLTLAMEPLRVAHLAVWPGYGDIMTAIQLSFRNLHRGGSGVFLLSSLLGLVAAGCFAFFLAKKQFDADAELALIALSSLLCFTHSIYDYVFLIFPLAVLLQSRSKGRSTSIAGWAAMLYLLFFGIVETYLNIYSKTIFVLTNLLALCILTASIITQARCGYQGRKSGVTEQPSVS